jgi:hypothetical protein
MVVTSPPIGSCTGVAVGVSRRTVVVCGGERGHQARGVLVLEVRHPPLLPHHPRPAGRRRHHQIRDLPRRRLRPAARPRNRGAPSVGRTGHTMMLSWPSASPPGSSSSVRANRSPPMSVRWQTPSPVAVGSRLDFRRSVPRPHPRLHLRGGRARPAAAGHAQCPGRRANERDLARLEQILESSSTGTED